jgi:hypothetical protein
LRRESQRGDLDHSFERLGLKGDCKHPNI